MIEPTEKDIGRSVNYLGGARIETNYIETGFITKVTNSYVFVQYDGDENSKATYPKDLEWGEVCESGGNNDGPKKI